MSNSERRESASFEVIYEYLVKYKDAHNDDMHIKESYVCDDGFALGYYAKTFRAGRRNLSAEQKSLLNDIGFLWRHSSPKVTTNMVINFLKEYYEEYGHTNIPTHYIVNGRNYYEIIRDIRTGNRKISDNQRAFLNEINFKFIIGSTRRKAVPFNVIYQYLLRYKETHNNDMHVMKSYVCDDGFPLGYYVYVLRIGRLKINEGQKQLLNNIGFLWTCPTAKIETDTIIKFIQDYYAINGNTNIPVRYKVNGRCYGQIIGDIRSGKREITDSQRDALAAINFQFASDVDPEEYFKKFCNKLKEYYSSNGNLNIREDYHSPDGYPLGMFASKYRCYPELLSKEQKATLTNIGFVWKVKNGVTPIKDVINLILDYRRDFGRDAIIPRNYVAPNGVRLGDIIFNISAGNRYISENDKKLFDLIKFKFPVLEIPNDEAIKFIVEYYNQYGNFAIPGDYVSADNIHLGYIVSRIRNNPEILSQDELDELNRMNFPWSYAELSHQLAIQRANKIFDEFYSYVADFKKENGHLNIPAEYTTKGYKLGRKYREVRTHRRKFTDEQYAKLHELGVPVTAM